MAPRCKLAGWARGLTAARSLPISPSSMPDSEQTPSCPPPALLTAAGQARAGLRHELRILGRWAAHRGGAAGRHDTAVGRARWVSDAFACFPYSRRCSHAVGSQARLCCAGPAAGPCHCCGLPYNFFQSNQPACPCRVAVPRRQVWSLCGGGPGAGAKGTAAAVWQADVDLLVKAG